MTKLASLTHRDVQYTDHKTGVPALLGGFNANMANHEMTILHEDGLYRHLRFRNPTNSFYWYDLITWPGSLTITGDMGTYTFRRVEDMFQFFRGYINTGYWAEKLQNGHSGGRSQVENYDEDLFKQWVVQDFWETSRDMDATKSRIWWHTIKDEVLDGWVNTTNAHAALSALAEVDQAHVAPRNHYADAWEAAEGWTRYDWHFEYCLAAVLTGIRTYEAHKQEETAA